MENGEYIEGGITAARGYRAAGVHAGIKGSRDDLALLVSDREAVVAGVFTRNRLQGAPVKFCRHALDTKLRARGVVVNSGNANACTGSRGLDDARRMAACAAEAAGVDAADMLVCSTGIIGVPLPMDKIEAGIARAAEALSPNGGGAAARAIMTTDTVPKEAARTIRIGSTTVRIGGMAKGAGMIEPDMATMLAFLTTDADVAPDALSAALRRAVNGSFNRISIDGDQSCNDTVLLFANGAAGGDRLDERSAGWTAFEEGLAAVCLSLALQIVRDGEGATKLVTVTVRGAVDAADARRAVRAVANSLLVKTAWFGGDPNWGRIIDAVGYSGARMEEDRIEMRFDDVVAVRNGIRSDAPLAALERVFAKEAFGVTIDLHLGDAVDVVYTCDCSEAYVRINSAYST